MFLFDENLSVNDLFTTLMSNTEYDICQLFDKFTYKCYEKQKKNFDKTIGISINIYNLTTFKQYYYNIHSRVTKKREKNNVRCFFNFLSM